MYQMYFIDFHFDAVSLICMKEDFMQIAYFISF